MRNQIIAVVLAITSVHAFAQLARAQQRVSHRADPRELDWRDAAKAEELTADELRLLEQNKFVIGGKEYKQVFEPYLGGSVPVFITSDSLLNAYHVLLEGSLKHVEHAQAVRLRKLLPGMWKGLEGPDKDAAGDSGLVKSARRRARIVLGTAIKLLGDQPLDPQADAEIAGIIDKEVKKAVEGKAIEKPAWLGPGDAGFRALDYSRFIPRGLYSGDAPLERYFRAVAWLEAIPFRVDNDEELVSAMLLGYSLSGSVREFLGPYREFLGAADDLGLYPDRQIFFTPPDPTKLALPQGLADVRATMHAPADRRLGQVNDQVRDASVHGEALAELTIRVLPPRLLPDAAMFQETTDRQRFDREYPNGLEVAAMLGSPFARAHLDADAKYCDKLLATIARYDAEGEHSRDRGIYEDYLQALSSLFEPSDKDVPAFFASQAWQAKNCQTALAGWTQMRHAWILQAKESVIVFGAMRQPSGFIEPTPEFFSRFAKVVTETETCLHDAGAFDPDIGMAAADLRKMAQIIETSKADANGVVDEAPGPGNWEVINFAQSVAQELRDSKEGEITITSSFLKSDAPKLRALADQLDRGEMPANPKVRQALLEGCKTEIAPLWRSMALTCRRLEALSQKQLRGIAFTAEEDQFIKGYGENLAAYMLYFGESYDNPRDDAPRVADVFVNPRQGKLLEVGIGRAKVIYVLYPWQGREILCRGAVMPYYEFKHERPLNDGEWKSLLDSPGRPDLPDWVKPIYGNLGAKK